MENHYYLYTRSSQPKNSEPGDRTLSLIELFALIKQIYTSKRGVTVMEYAVIASAVIIAIATVLKTVGSRLGNTFTNVSSKLSS